MTVKDTFSWLKSRKDFHHPSHGRSLLLASSHNNYLTIGVYYKFYLSLIQSITTSNYHCIKLLLNRIELGDQIGSVGDNIGSMRNLLPQNLIENLGSDKISPDKLNL